MSRGARRATALVLRVGTSLVVLSLLLLLAPAVIPGATAPASPGTPGAGPLPLVLPVGVLSDGASLSVVVGGVGVQLSDGVTLLGSSLGARNYAVSLHSSVNLPLVPLKVVTDPLNFWSLPGQMPGGADALPPMSDWTWTVTTPSGLNDTSNWSVTSSGNGLQRTTDCVSETFWVHGVAHVSVPISGASLSSLGLATPGVGLVLNPGSSSEGPLFPQNDSGYTGLVRGLHPSLLRFGEVDAGTLAHWSNSTASPVFNFTNLDAAFNLSAASGSGVLYTLSGGNWGDGNLLPRGMPLQTNLLINWSTSSGYLPSDSAYASYVRVIVDHIHAMNESVRYWSVGNEMPLMNTTVVLAFIGIFNVAQRVIHAVYPNALVGTDVMMNRTYLPLFAHIANNVGFLSFHYYPVIGMCLQNGQYCPPQGSGNGTLDKTFWMPYAQMYDENRYYAPSVAAMMWHNYTGHWVPVIDAESNLNGVGGSALNNTTGTDPRQQMLVGAAWDISAMMVGASQNLSAFTYYTLTGLTLPAPTLSGRYGGWGFGMTAEAYGSADRYYAPYWAFHMWSRYIANGAPGTVLASPQSTVIKAYEAASANGLSIVLVNGVGVPATALVSLNVSGYAPSQVTTLDQRSYVEQFNVVSQSEQLVKSGTHHRAPNPAAKTVPVVLDGYGVAIVHYVRSAPLHRALTRAGLPVVPHHVTTAIHLGSVHPPSALPLASAGGASASAILPRPSSSLVDPFRLCAPPSGALPRPLFHFGRWVSA